MKANYGYEDGTGTYYIGIDTNKCADCSGHFCMTACPNALFQCEEDDFEDEIVVIKNEYVHRLAEFCAECKKGDQNEKCRAVCDKNAITFTW